MLNNQMGDESVSSTIPHSTVKWDFNRIKSEKSFKSLRRKKKKGKVTPRAAGRKKITYITFH